VSVLLLWFERDCVLTQEFVEVQIVEAQLPESGIIGDNKPDKSAPHDWNSTQREYFDVVIKRFWEGQKFFN
jgi:hypothetical protein